MSGAYFDQYDTRDGHAFRRGTCLRCGAALVNFKRSLKPCPCTCSPNRPGKACAVHPPKAEARA